MSTTFRSLSELLENVEATKKRLQIIEQTANYLKTLSAEEIEAATNMMVGRAFPKYNQKTLDVSWSTLTRIFERISVFDWDLFRHAMAATGDIGSATKTVLEQTNEEANAVNSKIPNHNRSPNHTGSHRASAGFRVKNQKRTPNRHATKPSHPNRS
jgi:hypothetical protein